MTGVFISYSRKDEDFARQLATDLEHLKVDVWIDVDDIPPGSKWSTAIQEGLKTCAVMVLILSPDSIASSNVEDEWQFFMDKKKPIIPVMWRLTETHFQLNRLQYVDFSTITGDVPALADQPAYQIGRYLLREAIFKNGVALDPVAKPDIPFDPRLKSLSYQTRVWHGPLGCTLAYRSVYGVAAALMAVILGITALVLGSQLIKNASEPTPKPGVFAHPADVEAILPTASEVGLPDDMQPDSSITVTYTLSELVSVLRVVGLFGVADATQTAGEHHGFIAQISHGWRAQEPTCPETGRTEFQVVVSIFDSNEGAQAHAKDEGIWAAQIESGSFYRVEPADKGVLAVGARNDDRCGPMLFYAKLIPYGRFMIATAEQVTSGTSEQEVIDRLDQTNAYMVQKIERTGLR